MYTSWDEYCRGEILRVFAAKGIPKDDVKITRIETEFDQVKYLGRVATGCDDFWNDNQEGMVTIGHKASAVFNPETHGLGNPMI